MLHEVREGVEVRVGAEIVKRLRTFAADLKAGKVRRPKYRVTKVWRDQDTGVFHHRDIEGAKLPERERE